MRCRPAAGGPKPPSAAFPWPRGRGRHHIDGDAVRKPAAKTRKSCHVCSSPQRHEIEAARVAGCSLDAIAAKHGISRDAVWRHCSRHVSESAKAAYLADVPLAEVAERAAKEGGSILHYLALIRSTVTGQMLLAAQTNDGHRVAVLAGRAIECLTTIGKFSGELSELRSLTLNQNSVTLINAPAFARLEAMLVERLMPHPDALRAVLEGLGELHESPAQPALTIEGVHADAA